MKTLILSLSLIISHSCIAQIKVTSLNKKDIPTSFHFDGHIINAVRYSDNEGDHIVITTETGLLKAKDAPDDSFSRAELYAYNYLVKGDITSSVWQLHDFTGDCGDYAKAVYVPKTFAVTDLDKNGVAEVWMMYIAACRGDAVPGLMKIIMRQGVKKYAIRGKSKVQWDKNKFYGGEYILDQAFNNSPAVFKQYGVQLWKKNILEIW